MTRNRILLGIFLLVAGGCGPQEPGRAPPPKEERPREELSRVLQLARRARNRHRFIHETGRLGR